MDRTETAKILSEPVFVTLGKQSYEITPAVINVSMPWIKKIVALLSRSMSMSSLNTYDIDLVKSALMDIMGTAPEDIVNLVFEYAPYLPKDKIMKEAHSSQILKAFEAELEFEKPFLLAAGTLRKLTQ